MEKKVVTIMIAFALMFISGAQNAQAVSASIAEALITSGKI